MAIINHDYHEPPPATKTKHPATAFDTGGPDDAGKTSQRGWVNNRLKAGNTNRTKQRNAPAAIKPKGR